MDNKVVLVGIYAQGKEQEALKSLDELERLADTAGAVCVAKITQHKNTPDVATYIGSGKLEELKDTCKKLDAKGIIFDSELSPAQIRNIENETNCDVLDRSMLILDIFALHAVSAEGKIQVELAQLKYTAPRLIGKGKDLSRLGGGIGTRGPGESKLEVDRRRLTARMSFLQNELQELEKNRQSTRAQRDRSGITKACIVGYTNAGKSTLLNLLTNAGILAQDKLFATLDPTTRKLSLPSGIDMLLTDTVGFIRKLFADNGVIWQTAELGKVDIGGGGTVAMYIANHNIETVDLGVPVISMHAPYEVVSKADVYSTYEAFCAFVK